DNPPNRFLPLNYAPDPDLPPDDAPAPATRFFRDSSRTVIATNDSPDVGFTHSVNPYRGCENGCSYCYARPTHEYLGFSAGLDVDVLAALAAHDAAAVFLSVTTLDADLAGALEPRAARPAARLRAIEELAKAGVPVGVMAAPVIPGLTDHELPAILRAARDA